MAIGFQIVAFLHLIGFACLFGGCLAQLRASPPPEVNLAMLWGAWLQLITGIGMVVWLVIRSEPLPYVEYGIKLGLTLIVVVLVAKNRKFQSIPGGLLLIIAGLTLLNAGVAVFWPEIAAP
jgi:hypothetical protein